MLENAFEQGHFGFPQQADEKIAIGVSALGEMFGHPVGCRYCGILGILCLEYGVYGDIHRRIDLGRIYVEILDDVHP